MAVLFCCVNDKSRKRFGVYNPRAARFSLCFAFAFNNFIRNYTTAGRFHTRKKMGTTYNIGVKALKRLPVLFGVVASYEIFACACN